MSMKGCFRGVATALPTPFERGKIDFQTLERLVSYQLSAQVDALVFLGTTGEPCTLSERERDAICRFAVQAAKGKTKLIFGAGSNNTKKAILHAKKAQKFGADGLLVVTPYYNKCTQDGLVKYYQAVCSAVDIPVIAYAVPSRTGVEILPDTIEKLVRIPNFAGVKDASGNIPQAMEYLRLFKGDCDFYVGDDLLALPLLALGYQGIVSVLANIAPWDVKKLCGNVLRGELTVARSLSEKLTPLIRACFAEVNPIPIKTALSFLGFGNGETRSPLTKATKVTETLLLDYMDAYGLKVRT